MSSVSKPSRGPWLALVWFAFVVCDTLAQLGFKLTAVRLPHEIFGAAWWRAAFASVELWAATSALALAFLCWLEILKHSPIGIGFAATSITLVTVAIASWLWLGERLDFTQGLGGLLIIGGIFLLRDIRQ